MKCVIRYCVNKLILLLYIMKSFDSLFNCVFIFTRNFVLAYCHQYQWSKFCVNIFCISVGYLYEVLRKAKVTFIAAWNKVSSFISSDSTSVYASPLLYFYSLVVKSSVLPNIWKLPLCVPLAKSTETNIEN